MQEESFHKKKFIGSGLLGIILIAVMLWLFDPASIFLQISLADPFLLSLSLIPLIGFYLLRAVRWKILLIPVNDSVKISNTFWTTNIGYLVNLIIPVRFLGELIRAIIIDRKENVGFPQAVSSVAVERILDLLAISILGLVGISLASAQANIHPGALDRITVIGSIGILMLFLVCVLIIGTKREKKLLSVTSKMINFIPIIPKRFREKIYKFTADLIIGAKGISHNPRIFTISLCLTMLIWLMQFISIVLIFRAFEIQSPLSILLLGSMLIQLSFIFPAPPGFVGTYEAYWSIIFQGIGLTGSTTLLAAGIVSHILNVSLLLVLGFIALSRTGMGFSKILKLKR